MMTRHALYLAANLFSRCSNFVLFWIIVNRLGASSHTDWFFFVYGFVYFFIFIAFYSIECALVPVWPTLEIKERAKLLQSSLIVGAICSIPFQLIGLLFSLYLPSAFGFHAPSGKSYVIAVSILLFLQPLLAYNTALFSSLLQAAGHYFWPITSLFWRTLGVLCVLLLFSCSSVTCLAVAYTVGEVFRFLVFAAAAHYREPQLSLSQHVEMKSYRKHFVAILWTILIVSASVLNPYVDLVMVGQLGQGTATLVEYAGRLRGLPWLILSGFLTIVFGDWSREHGQALEWGRIKQYTWRISLAGMILALGLVACRQLWMPLVFRGYQFDPSQSAILDRLMLWYLLGIPFLIANGILSRGFMVLQRLRMLVVLAVATLISNVIFNLIFIRMFGVEGVAISTSSVDAVVFGLYYMAGARMQLASKNEKPEIE